MILDFCLFQGFPLPAESREASLNRRRIPVLQAAACFFLAGASPGSLLPLSPCSRRLPPHAVAPTHSSSFLGQGRRFSADSLERSLPSRSVVVARPGSSSGVCLTTPGAPRPRLLVRRLGCGLGCPSGRRGGFRSVVSGGCRPFNQCSGAVGSGARAPALSPSSSRLHGSHLFRQFYCGGLPAALGRNPFSFPQRDCSTRSPLGGVSLYRFGPSVHHGPEQCHHGCPVMPQQSSGRRVDAQGGGLRGTSASLASHD